MDELNKFESNELMCFILLHVQSIHDLVCFSRNRQLRNIHPCTEQKENKNRFLSFKDWIVITFQFEVDSVYLKE
jgi:hypothetical protein